MDLLIRQKRMCLFLADMERVKSVRFINGMVQRQEKRISLGAQAHERASGSPWKLPGTQEDLDRSLTLCEDLGLLPSSSPGTSKCTSGVFSHVEKKSNTFYRTKPDVNAKLLI